MTATTNIEVIVIGAGITGIGFAHYLRANKIPYLILEAKQDLGGVWNTHRWHGARCDSDFIKYSYSFKPYLSGQCLQDRQQIHQYLRAVATEFGIMENIRFDTKVIKAVFDNEHQRWTVHTNQGAVTARFLVNGNGYFSDAPYVPSFEGMSEFGGLIVHTSHLHGNETFADRDVVVVGSGATAICSAPALARVSKSLVVLQRSPSYIYEINNEAGLLVVLCQALHRRGLKFAVRWLRAWLQMRDDLIFVGMRRFPALAKRFFRDHWRDAIDDGTPAENFAPDYNPWQQRIPIAIGLKKALRNGELTLKTAEIKRFTRSSIVLKSGESLNCDVCVLATGLNLQFFNFEIFLGENKVDVNRINFYKGILAGGIPNYFHPIGSWHSAWTQRLEPVVRYAIKIVTHMRSHGLGTVRVERKELPAAPGITPNYIIRSLSTLPRLQGTCNLPFLDNVFANRFNPRRLQFSAMSETRSTLPRAGAIAELLPQTRP